MVKKVTMPPRSSCPMDEPRAEIWNQRSTAEGFFRVFSGDNDAMAAMVTGPGAASAPCPGRGPAASANARGRRPGGARRGRPTGAFGRAVVQSKSARSMPIVS